jgi:integrase/recombinase XerD
VAYVHRNLPLTDSEAAKLSAACRTPREKRVVWTLMDTGMTVSALANLTRARISLADHCLDAGASERRRAIPMTPRIAPLLESWFARNELFGLSVRSIQRTICQVASRSGLDGQVNAERLRRTFAMTARGGAKSCRSPLKARRTIAPKSYRAKGL